MSNDRPVALRVVCHSGFPCGAEMSPVFVVIADIVGEDSFEVRSFKAMKWVKQVTPAEATQRSGNAVLPRALAGRFERKQFSWIEWRGYVEPVLPIVIKYEKLGCRLEGKCFSQLLDNPILVGMASNIEVEDGASGHG